MTTADPAQPAGVDADAAAFEDAFLVARTDHAPYFAAGLFREAFGAAFPTPPPDNATTRAWNQYVAFYRWPDDRVEAVGFLNWIRHGRAYLGGGMAVRRGFYRRLPRGQFAACNARGGVAQLLLERSMRELTDCDAWFGYCGDRQAYAVDVRAGFEPTRHPFVLVRWCRELPPPERDALVDSVAALGPF